MYEGVSQNPNRRHLEAKGYGTSLYSKVRSPPYCCAIPLVLYTTIHVQIYDSE